MGKIFSVFIVLIIFLNATIIDEYKNKNYEKICNYQNIIKYKKDENILSIIGDSCIKINSLYLLPYIINYLKHTTIGRKNAIYFLVIYNEKKLLYSFLFDNFDIGSFDFPRTKHILSTVFDAVKNKKYKKIGQIYLIKENNCTVKMYKENDKMIIEKFDGIKTKRYWFR
ncbi:conserved hypothetical protein [Lebetimonas natsushimae]|uniref:Uncharacterized protein n=1 Tax=Lebetimonas natsushimae TaxID=1936991 RepID=A0A292YC63_9BACT|nr:hypothetical protein [Lebetimonas natsushimae]GAX87083.1 conserved hypothetical protein [Lebetimonas natsushimae]